MTQTLNQDEIDSLLSKPQDNEDSGNESSGTPKIFD